VIALKIAHYFSALVEEIFSLAEKKEREEARASSPFPSCLRLPLR